MLNAHKSSRCQNLYVLLLVRCVPISWIQRFNILEIVMAISYPFADVVDAAVSTFYARGRHTQSAFFILPLKTICKLFTANYICSETRSHQTNVYGNIYSVTVMLSQNNCYSPFTQHRSNGKVVNFLQSILRITTKMHNFTEKIFTHTYINLENN